MSGANRNIWKIVKTYWTTHSYSTLGLMTKNKAACGYHLISDPDFVREAAREILALYDEGKIKPKIDSVWAYEDVSFLIHCLGFRND